MEAVALGQAEGVARKEVGLGLGEGEVEAVLEALGASGEGEAVAAAHCVALREGLRLGLTLPVGVRGGGVLEMVPQGEALREGLGLGLGEAAWLAGRDWDSVRDCVRLPLGEAVPVPPPPAVAVREAARVVATGVLEAQREGEREAEVQTVAVREASRVVARGVLEEQRELEVQGEAVREARSEVAAGEPLRVTLGVLEVDLVRVTLTEADLLRVTEVQREEETVRETLTVRDNEAREEVVARLPVYRTHASRQHRSSNLCAPLLLIQCV